MPPNKTHMRNCMQKLTFEFLLLKEPPMGLAN
jgi:hypothetical protein